MPNPRTQDLLSAAVSRGPTVCVHSGRRPRLGMRHATLRPRPRPLHVRQTGTEDSPNPPLRGKCHTVGIRTARLGSAGSVVPEAQLLRSVTWGMRQLQCSGPGAGRHGRRQVVKEDPRQDRDEDLLPLERVPAARTQGKGWVMHL